MILIVDDDPSVTASLALLLKQAGYQSQTASGPAEALAWLERGSLRARHPGHEFLAADDGRGGARAAREDQSAQARRAGRAHHRVGIDCARGGRHEGGRVRLRHEALEQPADAPDGADDARPGRKRSCIAGRARALARGARRTVRLRRFRGRGCAPPSHPAARGPRGPNGRGRARHRRERHRQGTGRGSRAPQQPASALARS